MRLCSIESCRRSIAIVLMVVLVIRGRGWGRRGVVNRIVAGHRWGVLLVIIRWDCWHVSNIAVIIGRF